VIREAGSQRLARRPASRSIRPRFASVASRHRCGRSRRPRR